jgi:predicted PurR-regulated permease PerM
MEISSRTILRILALTAAFIALLALAYIARRPLIWIGTAFFFAVALNPAVEFFTRRMPRKNRALGAATVFFIMLGILAFLLISFIPPLIDQSASFSKQLPHYSDELINGHSFLSDQVRRFNLVTKIRQSQDQLLAGVTTAGSQAYGIARAIFSSIVAAITILVLTYFMMLEGPTWMREFWRLIPPDKRKHQQKLAAQMYKAVTGYVNGNLLTSLIAAVSVAIILTIIRVPFAIPLGIFVGIMDLLPLVGATIGAIVVIAVALFTSLTAAVIMAIFFIVYQQVENHLMQPLVYGKTVEISPLLVLIAVLVGATVGGLVGALVAIPLFASLQIVVRDYAERRIIKD